jgi:hypothetical protein
MFRFRKALLHFPLALALPVLSIANSAGEKTAATKVLRAQDFAENPDLVAEPQQSVLLDNTLPAEPAAPAVRYRLESGSHWFCLSGSDPYYTGLILKDRAGNAIFNMPRGQHCQQADLSEGTYTVQVSHSNAVPDSTLLTFVDVDEPGACRCMMRMAIPWAATGRSRLWALNSLGEFCVHCPRPAIWAAFIRTTCRS